MSVASANFFAALQEESSGPGVHLERQPGVAVSTSSKKADRAPAKADPSKARAKAKELNGNEAAIRNKSAGRAANKDVPVGQESTTTYHRSSRSERTDRIRRSTQKDSERRVRRGWGGDKTEGADEAAAEAIAKEDLAHDAAEDAAEDAALAAQTLTLDQYYQQQSDEGASSLNTRHSTARQPNEGADNAQWADAKTVVKEELAEPSRRKALRSKPQKELPQVLEIDPVTPSRAPREERREREDRGRGPRREQSSRGPRGDRGDRSERKPFAGKGKRPEGKRDGKEQPARRSGKPGSRHGSPNVDLTALPKLA